MITARELVFYIRAEDQASRVVKRVGKSFGSLANIRDLESKASKQQLSNLNAIDKAQQRIRRNDTALQRAQVQASRLGRIVARGGAARGYTINETYQLHQAALQSVATLNKEEELLVKNLDDVRIAGDAASASIDRQINEAKIARVNNYATGFSNVARAIRLVGVVAGASLVYAAHQAATFNTQLTLAASQARPAGAGANATLAIQGKLQTVVLKQMQEFPATSKEMADSLYQIFSGSNVQNIGVAGKLLEQFNKAAVAGQTDLGSITDAGITLLNNFVGKGKEFKSITQALNLFFSAVRYGRMNVEQFAGSLSNVVSSGKAAGNNFKDIADAMAALTRQTGAAKTSRDATGLARLYEMLIRPDVVTGLKKIGVNEVDPLTNKLKPLLQVITDIKAKADLKGINAVNFFKTISALGSGKAGTAGTIQGRRAFQYLIQDLTNYQKVSKDVNKDNNEFMKSYEALAQSPGVRWQVVTNQIKAAVIVIGTEAIPALVRLAKPLVDAIHWFNGLSDSTKHTIAVFSVLTSAAAVIGGTFVIAISSIVKLAGALKLLKLEAAGSATGSASIFGAISIALVSLSIILVKYPGILHAVTNALGGTTNALKVLLGVLTLIAVARYFTTAKIVSGLTLIGTSASVASGKAARLRLALLGIVAVGAIGIPIVLNISESFKGKKPGTQGIKFDKGLRGLAEKGLAAFSYGALRAFGQPPAAAHQGVIDVYQNTGDIGHIYTNTTPASAMKNLRAIWASPFSTEKQHQAAVAAYQAGDYATIAKIAAAVKIGVTAEGDREKNAYLHKRYAPTIKKAATVAAAVKSSAYMQQLKNVGDLDLLYIRTHSLKNLKNYLNALAALNATYSSNLYTTYTSDYLNRVESADTKSLKKRTDATKAAYEKSVALAKTYASQVSNAITGVTEQYNTLLQQNQSNFGALFQGPYLSSPLEQARLGYNNQQVRPMDVLNDLLSESSRYGRFNNQVSQLSKKGAPKGLIDQLNAMGPSAPGAPNFIDALDKLPPAAFKRYVAVWNRSQNAIKKNTIDQLNAQLATYKKFGSNVALAIIAGLKSQDLALQAQLKSTLEKMFPAFAELEKKAKPPKHPTTTKKSNPTTVVHQDNSTHDNSIVVHNPVADHVDTSLSQAAFRNRNKRS